MKQITSKKQKNLTTTLLKVSEGFITDDGYGAIPYGKKLMIIFNGHQLEVVNTILQAQKFIEQHRATPQSGTVFV